MQPPLTVEELLQTRAQRSLKRQPHLLRFGLADKPSDPPIFEFTTNLSHPQRDAIRSITRWQNFVEL